MATNFGRDISCAGTLRTGRFVSGVRLVAEAAYRRLTTPRGMLRGGEVEKNYGIDLTEVVGSTSPRVLVATLPGRIRAELMKDERIQSVNATVVPVKVGVATNFKITIDAVTGEGPFTLQLLASAVTVELLGIT